MIISDSEKFVFVHNPKVGGMTFRLALMRFETRDNFFFEWRRVGESQRQLDMAHITPFQLRKFFPKMFEEISGYYKFAFVRNPYERFLSALSQHLKLCTPYFRHAVLAEPNLFYQLASSFALNSLKQADIERDLKLVHFRRQSNFVFLDQIQWVDDIFKLENLDAVTESRSSAWLGDAIHTPKNQTTQFINGYDVSQLSSAAISAINSFYQIDFERFGYEMRPAPDETAERGPMGELTPKPA